MYYLFFRNRNVMISHGKPDESEGQGKALNIDNCAKMNYIIYRFLA